MSIIIPVKPGGRVRALAALSRLRYPAELFEVLIAYGRVPSAQRNLAAAEASGELLYFLDDDSRVAPGFLEAAVHHFEDAAVAAVGGPSLTPESDSPLQRAIGIAFASAVGGGGVRNRYRQIGKARSTSDSELILCNLGFRREVFLSHGGLDARLYPNEENELMDRLQQEGYRLIHDPQLAVYRSQRATYRAYLRQMYSYGRGRGEQTRLAGKLKPVSLAPSLLLAYILSLPLVRCTPYALPFFGYLAAMVAASVLGSLSGRDLSLLPRLLAVFPALHLVYGAGVIRGLVAPRYRQGTRESGEIEVRRVKAFEETVEPLAAEET
ncbi:glycosyltransferase family 2 protein [Geomonas sp.]|uniref:glycosyltransferase family 2 protein n=1 Tax=Geomonas sp. TaxID=2651584 RepID=UPI002B49CC23|nr:glycosyltransferase family 2 protein [Geomonas sp.]HJV33615.1 glycosyltransferase family 2 protein [Geomonas sp.]